MNRGCKGQRSSLELNSLQYVYLDPAVINIEHTFEVEVETVEFIPVINVIQLVQCGGITQPICSETEFIQVARLRSEV